MRIDVLDHGYIRLVESYGHGDAGKELGDHECGIVEAARQSTKGNFRSWEPYWYDELTGELSFDTEKPAENWKRFPKGDLGLLEYLYSGKPQHATPFEFAGCIIEVQAPIFVFREWHRHRTQSYNEMSARYAPLPDLNYVPSLERLLIGASTTNKQAGTIKGSSVLDSEEASEFRDEVCKLYMEQEAFYQKWLSRGVPKELARIDLPVGRYTRMRANANLRNWLGFMTLRSDPGAQWEIRQYSDALGMILESQFPKTLGLFKAKGK